MTSQTRRQQLLQLYQTGLAAVSGELAVARFLQRHPLGQACSVVAIGKAAAAMARGAQQALGAQLRTALVITKHGHTDPSLTKAVFHQLESSHPIPDDHSLQAGEALLAFLAQLPDDEPLLFLLSGGASSLVEVLPSGVTTQQLAELNRWLLGSGLAIGEMNAIRRQLSTIKGGGLVPHLRGRRCLQLLISDVPGNELAVVGSGPLIHGAEVSLPTAIPEWLHQLLALSQRRIEPDAGNIETHLIADNALARQAITAAARQQGLVAHNHPGEIEGEVELLAVQLCETLQQAEAGLHLWGGESSVVLPPNPGRGGRNQHLALAMARYLAGHDNILFLAAGTDGSDGPTEDVGALVDGGTLQRGEWEGLDAMQALECADAGTFLQASGDLIQTGPTGTNVMDLMLAWKW